MKKQELAHMHGLFYMIHTALENDGVLDLEKQTKHEKTNLDPTTIHAAKNRHHKAVNCYIEDIVDSIQATTSPTTNRKNNNIPASK